MKKLMRQKRPNVLLPTLCLTALLGGAWVGVMRAALSRSGRGQREDAPAVVVPSQGPEKLDAPAPEPTTKAPEVTAKAPERAAPVEVRRTEAKGRRATPTAVPTAAPKVGTNARPQERPKAAERDAAPKGPDLSAYRVHAVRSDQESLLPEDRSLSAKELSEQQKAGEKGKTFDGGKGLIGDVYRGTKRFVDSLDAATLDASRQALGSVAKPDKATLRPTNNGVRLHIEIPPETVKVR